MTARERLAPLAARLRAALADEKQRVNLLVNFFSVKFIVKSDIQKNSCSCENDTEYSF